VFMLATTYVLSGPYLLARGERIEIIPALKPAAGETPQAHKSSAEQAKTH